MKVKELIEKLKQMDPDAEIWVGTHNDERIPTYGLLDYVYEFNFEELWVDLFPTPGDIDMRLIEGKNDKDKIIFLGTSFGH